jgi:hypothetical protein
MQLRALQKQSARRLSGWIRTFLIIAAALFLAGCGSLDTIPYSPPQTPETWLQIQPYTLLRIGANSILLVQPTTTAIVYLLGLVTLVAGGYFLRTRKKQWSRFWWGIALLCWGAGAWLAGTSYEAFSYQIKCAGRAACVWTSGWEIGYLLLSVASVDAMLIAVAYSCAAGKRRKVLTRAALVSMAVYLTVVMIGALIPVPFLISFELLILVAAPNILVFLALNGWRYAKYRQRLDLALLGIWSWLILTIAAYFLYYLSGLTNRLWQQGIWFSENDVLHIGLILWMVYIAAAAGRHIKDETGNGITI